MQALSLFTYPFPPATIRSGMTEYGFVHSNRITSSSSTVEEKKAARKKLLEQVEQRRKQNYIRWKKKMQLKATGGLDTIT